jgi:hypothetical protein
LEKLNHWVEDWLFGRAEANSTRKVYFWAIKVFYDFYKSRGKDLYGVVEDTGQPRERDMRLN